MAYQRMMRLLHKICTNGRVRSLNRQVPVQPLWELEGPEKHGDLGKLESPGEPGETSKMRRASVHREPGDLESPGGSEKPKAAGAAAERTPGREHGTTAPVIFFNASTRLEHVSLNAGFSLVTSWALRFAQTPVIHFACNTGMSQCPLGANPDHPEFPPPCNACTRQSRALFSYSRTHWFSYAEDEALNRAMVDLNVGDLSRFEFDGCPLGEIVLPTVRWVMRCHDLPDTAEIRGLFRQFIHSAHNIAVEFAKLVENSRPSAVVLFNGILFPEAAARWVALRRGIRAITHEVGFEPLSAFFSVGHATAYLLDIPADFQLTAKQNARLDAYLERRFQGDFSMAGIRFWPQMRSLDGAFQTRAKDFRQIVPVFTNVIFDTSQIHANKVFEHMFEWLETILPLIRGSQDTLFVVRAHPDEMRSGKQSRQSVRNWVERNGMEDLQNVLFVDSNDHISSYELIRRAKFVCVYNSSIGLEASILGKPVLCAGAARYTRYPTVTFPETIAEYTRLFGEFLDAENIPVPAEFQANSRRFLYYQLYKASIPFGEFLEADPALPGFVQFVKHQDLRRAVQDSKNLHVLRDGILDEKPFVCEDADAGL